MAFHVACPLTCRKLCNCTLGSSGQLRKLGGREAFLRAAVTLHKMMNKSPRMNATGEDTVEVLVPRISKESTKKKKKKSSSATAEAEVDEEEAGEAEADVPTDTAAATAAEGEQHDSDEIPEASNPVTEPEPVAAEDPVIPLANEDEEFSDEKVEADTPPQVEEVIVSEQQVFCGLCLQPEIAGSKRDERMLTCEGCERRFHRKCLKSWAANRDLFNWKSWRCSHCRTCEDCKATGDPNRLMFCKRCDEAHHNNCKQMGAKAPAVGPYLCPKHSQCHSCGTRVAGGGASSRWSHSHLFCDACGRLFSKSKYCPVCLKVYRESEPTPMVQCDNCEHWLHCTCEDISPEKYEEYQNNSDLKFTCAACTGACFQASSVDEAVAELWRRKDEADREQIANARASAGLPSESEMAELCPSSEDEKPTETPKESKKGKWVIKFVKKDQKPASTFKSLKRGGKLKGEIADDTGTEAAASHEVEDGNRVKKFAKKKKPADEIASQTSKVKGSVASEEKQVAKSGTKIKLHVPAKKTETRLPVSTSEEETKDDDMVEQHSDDGGQQPDRRKAVGTSAAKRSRPNEDLDLSKKKMKQGENNEPEPEKKPLKLKFRSQEVEASATRGQRSKRKRPSTSHEDGGAEPESDEDDTSILQRLGLDAVTKRVEICRSSDKTWLKGTIVAVNQRRSQFTVNFDNGDKKLQKYGKERIRLLGKR